MTIDAADDVSISHMHNDFDTTAVVVVRPANSVVKKTADLLLALMSSKPSLLLQGCDAVYRPIEQ